MNTETMSDGFIERKNVSFFLASVNTILSRFNSNESLKAFDKVNLLNELCVYLRDHQIGLKNNMASLAQILEDKDSQKILWAFYRHPFTSFGSKFIPETIKMRGSHLKDALRLQILIINQILVNKLRALKFDINSLSNESCKYYRTLAKLGAIDKFQSQMKSSEFILKQNFECTKSDSEWQLVFR